jgi:thiamine kinase-like enzyme
MQTPDAHKVDATWPQPLQHYLMDTYGRTLALEQLFGLSHNCVYRLDVAGKRLIVKQTYSANEAVFYEAIAPQLAQAAIPLPYLEFSLSDEITCWLVLEYIPHKLPAHRQHSDQELLAILYRLHQVTLAAPDIAYYQPDWPDAMTDTTCSLLQAMASKNYTALLQKAQSASKTLMQPGCWISGDPNPANWGLRADQSLVLYDWERFGRGTPAIDIAISLAGLPTTETFCEAARLYLMHKAIVDDTLHTQFVRELILAKTFIILEFIHTSTLGETRDATIVARLMPHIQVWLDTVLQPIL